ncbi:MAG: hypothetical protein WD794_16990 [Mycobacteriales bacterium]
MTRHDRTLSRILATALATALFAGLASGTAQAGHSGNFEAASNQAPPSTSAPQYDTAKPTPTRTCRMYGSASGYGMLCSDGPGGAGLTLAALLLTAGLDFSTMDEFCWDDPDLPDGFQPAASQSGPGRWWLHTCLSFDGNVVSRTTARLAYEFDFHAPDTERRLTASESAVLESITGRGQIPFLQVQTSPISSPRVGQDVAFSMLCDSKVQCSGGRVATPPLTVGGVTMHAELVHLRVLPEGPARPEKEINCVGAGRSFATAEALDQHPDGDPTVCRYRYERSSKDAGGGTSGDRYPAVVIAFWQIYYDQGDGVKRKLGLPYEKSTTNQIRVTEVQTLVVS